MIIEGLSIPRFVDKPLLSDYLPYGHQIFARSVIEEKEKYFLFITSPTGSGKTDSWAVPALTSDNLGVVFALYPTNALAKDQYNSLASLKAELNSRKKIEFLTAETIKQRKKEYPGYSKGDIIENIVRDLYRDKGGIVITNPDTFIYIMKKYYSNPYLDSTVRNLVDTIVFDEFHLYDIKQSEFILFLLHDVLSNKQSSLKKFIFLSATPEERIIEVIREIMGEELIIADENYNGEIADERMILPEVEAEFYHAKRFASGEKFIDMVDQIAPFFEEKRTAIIFDSVLEVRRISEILRGEFGFNVCEVSGISKDSIDDGFDVLVGNKAVEVGVDFKGKTSIENLILSGHTVSEYLQRFGRLRNPKDGIKYRAFCFVPKGTVDVLSRFSKISRSDLVENLKRTMKDPRVFENFKWRYGYIEALDYIKKNAMGVGLRDEAELFFEGKIPDNKGGMPDDKRNQYLSRVMNLVRSHYLNDGNFSDSELKDIASILFNQNKAREVLRIAEQLSPFRGTSYDLLYLDNSEEINRYDLFYLLRWGDLDILSRDEFVREVRGKFTGREINDLAGNCYGYALLNGFLEKPRKVTFNGRIFKEINLPESERGPCFVHGISLRIKDDSKARLPDISDINKRLEKEGLFVRYSSFSPYHSKKLFDIDDYTPIFGFKDGSVAIGTDAIFVDCAIKAFYESLV